MKQKVVHFVSGDTLTRYFEAGWVVKQTVGGGVVTSMYGDRPNYCALLERSSDKESPYRD